MLGYIRAYTPELRIREHEYYRAAYCGLCRALGKCCGCTSKMTLSYDMVFALLVKMALSGTEPEFETGRCALHPFKKRQFMKINPELAFCAKAGTLLTCGKLEDDIRDERGFKRFSARLVAHSLVRAKKRAEAELSPLNSSINEGLSRLCELENAREASIDTPADVFGGVMAEIMAFGFSGGTERIAREIGRRAGRWVYIVDAVDDCERDIKKGSYNPFALMYGTAPDKYQRDLILDALSMELSKIRNALDLVDRGERRDMFEIIENILCFGMVESARRAVFPNNDERKKH